MDDGKDLAAAKEQVFLNIGRNILLFQQMEQLAKAILRLSSSRVQLDEAGAVVATASPQPDSRSLGQVAGALFKEVVVPNGTRRAADSPPANFSAPSLSSSVSIQTDSAQHTQQEAALRRVVEQRNALVHAFVPMWDWKSVESMEAATRFLVNQRAEAEQQFDNLKNIWKILQESSARLKSYFDSEAGGRLLELAFSPLVLALCDAAAKYAREDGWTLLSVAGQYVHQKEKEEMENLKALYGFSSLSELIAGVSVFEVKTEPAGAGTRQIYRLRPE